MKINAIDDFEKKIAIELDLVEAGHLFSFLMHSKFSDDVNFDVVGSPTMNALLRGLLASGKQLGWPNRDAPWLVQEGSERPPQAFGEIESYLKNWLKRDDVDEELREWLYPFEWVKPTSELT